jgi:hypothetical protein
VVEAAGFVLGSPEWFAQLAAILTDEVARAPEVMGDASFSFEEVLRAAPPDGRDVCWNVSFEAGRIVAMSYGMPLDAPDVSQSLTWEDALPLAALPRADPVFQSSGQRLWEAGGITIAGDLELKLSRDEVFGRLHDRLAPLTRAPA